MIVHQNNYDYNAKYIQLFDDACEILKDETLVADSVYTSSGRTRPSERFTCLEEYFMYLDILSTLHANKVSSASTATDASTKNAYYAQYSKFLMLPLDEEYFTINANTRIISTPSIFTKYGVSLNGD
jgi:hypothetical protein